MNIKPLGERVLIQVVREAEKTKGGIYIPESAKGNKKEGKVIAVGTTKEGKELALKKGTHILYGGYSGEEFEFEGEKYLILDFKDVIATIEGGQK